MTTSGSSTVEIRSVSGRAGLREFVRFPFALYMGAPYWVPPLISDEIRSLDPAQNPAFELCESRYWMAYLDGRAVGRVAAYLNRRDNERRGTRILRFGYMDFIDDRKVSSALLESVMFWANELGMEVIEGPQGAGHFDRNGVLVEGFETEPTIVSACNYPYYADHLEALGLQKAVDYLEHRIRFGDAPFSRLERISERLLKRKGLRVWQARNRKELLGRAPEIFKLINEAYVGLHDFVPLIDREMNFLIGQFFSYVDLDFVKIVMDSNARIVACGVAMPSYATALRAARGKVWPFGWLKMMRAMKTVDVIELYLVAVDPELRGAGLNAILMYEMQKSAKAAGFKWAESTGELETNDKILAMWKAYESKIVRRRRIYSMEVG